MPKTALKVKNFFKSKNINKYIFALIIILPALIYLFVRKDVLPPKLYPQLFGKYIYQAQNDIYKVEFGEKQTEKPKVKITRKEGSVEFTVQTEQNTNILRKGESITFQNINEGVDIRYITLENGVKEEIVLNRKSDLNIYYFDFKLDNLTFKKNVSNEYEPVLVTNDGKYVFHFEPPYAYDSLGVKTNNATFKIQKKDDQFIGILEVDKKWLTNKKRTFPVYIDPSIIHDTSSEFSTSIFNRSKDTGSGSSPKIETYYQSNLIDQFTVGYWKFNETVNNYCTGGVNDICDQTTNDLDIAVSGTTINTSTPFLGTASRAFNGTSDYAYLADNDLLDPKELTIEVWIKPTTLQTGNFVNKGDNLGYRFRTLSTGQLQFLDRGTTNILGSTTTIQANVWSHVAVTANNEGLKIYINGVLDSYNNVPYGSPNSSTNFYLGTYNASSEYFAGEIDELRISNVARSPEEIKQNAQRRPYSYFISDVIDFNSIIVSWDSFTWSEVGVKTGDLETFTSTSNLIAQWKLNSGSGTTATNDAGSCSTTCNGTLTGFANTSAVDVAYLTGWTANQKKAGNSALMFDGTNDYVDLGINKLSQRVNGASKITLGAWFKVVNFPTTSARGRLINAWMADGYTGFALSLFDNNKIEIGGRSNTGDGFQTLSYVFDNPHEWQFAVGVIDFQNELMKLYMNGVLVKTQSVAFANATYTTGTPSVNLDALGSAHGADYYFGTLDTPFLFSRELTEAEIISLYNSSNVEIQTRVGSDATPNDGSWEEWKPTSTETNVYGFDTQMAKDLVLSLPMGAASVLEDYSPNKTMLSTFGTGGLGAATGKISGASDFESTESDYAEAPDSDVLSTGDIDYTGSVWVNMESKSNHMVIISKDDSATIAEYRLLYNSSVDRFRYVLLDNSGTEIGTVNADNLGSPSISTWYNIIFWHDSVNNEVCIQVNNGTANCSATTGVPADTSALFRIGARLTTEIQFFDGIIDEINIWKRLLTTQEKSVFYNGGSPEYSGYGHNQRISPQYGGIYTEDENVIAVENNKSIKISTNNSLPTPYTVGIWHMEETGGSGAWMKDSSGNGNHGTPTNCYSMYGFKDQTCEFNGSNTSIAISNESNFDFERTQAFSIEAWVKTSSTTEQKVFSKLDSNPQYSGYELYVDTSGYLSFYLINNWGTGNVINIHSTTTKINDGKWHHVAVSYSGSSTAAGVTLYVDGLAQTKNTHADNLTATILNNITPRIGSRNAAAFFWNGYIDQVRVTSKAIASIEVREAFRASREQYFDFYLPSSTDFSSKNYLSFQVAGNTPGTTAQLTIGESRYDNYQPDGATVGLWHMDDLDISGATARDSSGNNYNGTLTGTMPSEGIIGQGKYFNGTTDYIDAGTSALTTFGGNFTLEAWIRTTDTGNTRTFLSKGQTSDWLYAFSKSTNDKVYCKVYQANSGTGFLEVEGQKKINDGQWHHVACVLSGTTLTVYVDGMPEAVDNTTAGTRDFSTAGTLNIGRFNWSTTYNFLGDIDEVRISNNARSSLNILAAYHYKSRTYDFSIDFGAYLSAGNLISNSSDYSFSISTNSYGLDSFGDRLYPGEKVIVFENYDGTEYKAQGTVSTINNSSGAVTVSSWDTGSTFPSGGFTSRANVFKWQREFWDISGISDSLINASTIITLRTVDGFGGKSFYIDDLKSLTNYLTTPTGSTITSSTGNRYFQYKVTQTTNDRKISSQLTSLNVTYTANIEPNTPTLSTPATNSISQNIPVSFTFSATDNDSDYLRYKIEICKNPEMDLSCTVYDQTSSQTGWSGQNTQSNTAYTSGSTATYTTSSLNYGQTYFWRTYAIDPAGMNIWSSTQITPFSLTTNDPTRSLNSNPLTIFSSTIQNEVTVTNSGWNNITGTVDSETTASTNGWIDSSNFDLNKKYLIIAVGSHNSDSLSGKSGLRILHGNTVFNESESIDITLATGTSFKSPYLWFTIWTPVANEDIEMQLYWNGIGTIARAEDITLLAIDVTDQIDNGNLFFKEVPNLIDITSINSTTTSLSFTPQNSNEAWWILGYNQTDFTTGSGAGFNNSLKINGIEGVTENNIYITSSDVTPIIPIATIQNFNNSNNTVEIQASTQNINQKSRHSAIMALNVSELLDHTKTFLAGSSAIVGTDTWNQQISLPIYNSVNNADWIVLGGGTMYANQEQVVGRITLDSNAITDSVGGRELENGELVPFVLSDYTQNLSVGLKTFKLEAKAFETSGGPGITGPWLIAFSREMSPTYTDMNLPSNQAINQSLVPPLKMTAVDPDSDYIRYKVKVCTNEAMTQNCYTYDQTISQTGWSGQNTQSNTAYTSGTQATYNFQSNLNQNQTYYWIAYSIDPAGTNTFHSDNPVPYSFTTTSEPTAPTELLTEGVKNPISVTDLTPEFSAIHNDPNGDSALLYVIQVNTQPDFLGTMMWYFGTTLVSPLTNSTRSPDFSYNGTALTYNGATYYWRIRFYDSHYIGGAWSEVAQFTMKSVDAPTQCRIVKTNDNSQINVYWTDISTLETGYIVEQKMDGGAWTTVNDALAPNSNSITINVSNNHTYQYRIAAKYNSIIGGYCTTDIASLYNGNFRLEGLKLEGVQIW